VETSESVDEQIQKADALLARGVDYLALHPWDGDAVVPLITTASSQGVKVIILVDGVPGVVEDGKALTFVSGNEVEAAGKIGEMVAGSAAGPLQAALITGTPGNLSAENRARGFTEGVAGSDVEIVAQDTANWARDEALQVAGDMLTAHPELDLVFAGNDEMALGAVAALEEARRADQVDVIGWNGTCVGLRGLLDGDLMALAALPFDEFGRTAIRLAVADSEGEDIEPRVEPEVPILTAETARAILDGSEDASDSLKAGLAAADAGDC
jgi:ABC-type sugar transport system substrate-binding protein